MKKIITLFVLLISVSMSWSQGVKVGVNAGSPDASSMFEIESNTKGFLPPRMTTAERDAIVNPADGLIVFNTNTNCINYRAVGAWYDLCGVCSPLPTTPAAGPDQLNVSGTSAALAANTPVSGSASWSIVSGSGGSFLLATNPSTTFSGNAGTSYTLRWTITTVCGSVSDDVVISFAPAFTCGQSLSYSGTSYTTALIAGQCWFTKNLNVGTEQNLNTNSTNNGTIEKYCYDGLTSNCNTWGGLYQWNELMNYSTVSGSQGICPTGWHIATDGEWTAAYAASPASLQSLNSGVLCNGGNCGGNVYYANGSTYGYYWTATEQSVSEAKRRAFQGNSQIVNDYISKNMGMSVRCVQN